MCKRSACNEYIRAERLNLPFQRQCLLMSSSRLAEGKDSKCFSRYVLAACGCGSVCSVWVWGCMAVCVGGGVVVCGCLRGSTTQEDKQLRTSGVAVAGRCPAAVSLGRQLSYDRG